MQDPSYRASVQTGTEKCNKQQQRQVLLQVQQSSLGTQAEQVGGQLAALATLSDGIPEAAGMPGKRPRKQKFDSLKF